MASKTKTSRNLRFARKVKHLHQHMKHRIRHAEIERDISTFFSNLVSDGHLYPSEFVNSSWFNLLSLVRRKPNIVVTQKRPMRDERVRALHCPTDI